VFFLLIFLLKCLTKFNLIQKLTLGGATTVPLSTAETILLAFFKKGYTKEIKKEEHLNPLCRELKIRHFKAKDKSELIMILAKELLFKKRVVLKEDADFYCLHRDSISVR